MSKSLSHLLDKPEILVSSAIEQLESLCHYASEDVKLLAEINLKVREKTLQLGLDPDDTTDKELYHSLLEHFKNDEQMARRMVGLQQNDAPEKFANIVVNLVSHVYQPGKVLAPKRPSVKKLLRENPPRQTMKKFNYRSVDSLLKRENIAELCAAIDALESQRWQKNFWRGIAKMQPSDFEQREIEIVQIRSARYNLNAQTTGLVAIMPHIGALAVWPSTDMVKLGVVGSSLMIVEGLNELKFYSAYLKLRQMENNLGSVVLQSLKEGIKEPLRVANLPLAWRTIFHHYGRQTEDEHYRMFELQLEHADVQAQKSIEALSKVLPGLSWWKNLNHVAPITHKKPISFNLLDIVNDASFGLPYSQRSLAHLQNGLWHELIGRYMEHSQVRNFMKQQIYPEAFEEAEVSAGSRPSFLTAHGALK